MSDERICGMSRRCFLQGVGAAAGYAAVHPLAETVLYAGPLSPLRIFPKRKARVPLVFIHVPAPRPTWPTKDYDYAGRKKELAEKLVAGCPGVEFDVKTVSNMEQANALIKETPDVDGYMVYQIGLSSTGAEAFIRCGKPVVLVDDLYGGTGQVLRWSGVCTRENLPVAVISSSKMDDVIAAANLFEVIRSMKESTILIVTDRNLQPMAEQVKAVWGSNLISMRAPEINAYYDKADVKEAEKWADYWTGNAKKVVEPKREDIVNSGKMHLALCRAAADKRADAVSVDCLGLFYTGKIHAYPCLSFFEMNNCGGTGVCESDVQSTCTQLMLRYLTRRPGYVSDPVIDTSTGEIIYAHCVSTNRVYGPKGKPNPYILRTHAEDNAGVAVQSLLPTGEDVTTLVVSAPARRMVIHSGKTTRNINESKACRTKIAAKTNAKAILKNWDLGWHRVTVYGDYREQLLNLARLLKIEAFEEDKA